MAPRVPPERWRPPAAGTLAAAGAEVVVVVTGLRSRVQASAWPSWSWSIEPSVTRPASAARVDASMKSGSIVLTASVAVW
jgi:hypothetical protein